MATRSNIIELHIKGFDEASPALKGVTSNLEKFGEVIGVAGAAGIGGFLGGALSQAVSMLTEKFKELASIPAETANAMGNLVQRMDDMNGKLGEGARASADLVEKFNLLRATVGDEGLERFRAFHDMQKDVNFEWEAMKINIADATIGIQQFFLAVPKFFPLAMQLMFGVSPTSGAPRKVMGPNATAEQLQYAQRLKRLAEEEAAAREKARKEAERAEELRRKQELDMRMRSYNSVYRGMGIVGPQMRSQAELLEGFGGEGGPMSLPRAFSNTQQLAIDAATAAANSFQMIASGLFTTIRSMGDALRAFLTSVGSQLLGLLARMGIMALGNALIPGGGILTAIGTVLAGKSSATKGVRLEGAAVNVNVFQGLNTRDMFMAVGTRQGSLSRANDLIALRAHA